MLDTQLQDTVAVHKGRIASRAKARVVVRATRREQYLWNRGAAMRFAASLMDTCAGLTPATERGYCAGLDHERLELLSRAANAVRVQDID